MAFPVIGGTQESGYNIDNSLRLNDGDSAYLSKSLGSSAGGSNTNATFSFWIKRGVLQGQQILFNSYVDANNYFRINLRNDTAGTAPSAIEILDIASGSDNGSRFSNQVFRDVSAWYHIFVTTDSDNGTNEDRVKVYINNERITSWASSVSWGSTFKHFADNATLYVGTREGAAQFYDGYFAEFNAVDGQELAPTDFGETDDNGVWIPKNYTGSYGTNGFKLEFKQLGTAADATSIGADTSGNDNHFSQTNVTPAVDRTTDTPTNNFCTLNAVDNDGFVTSEGNCDFDSSSGSDEGIRGTMGVQNGKWYYECKITGSAGLSAGNIGYANPVMQLTENPRGGECAVINGSSSTNFYNNSASAVVLDAGAGIVQNDIVGVALDLDSGTKTIAFYRNGSIIGSAQTIASALLDDFLLPCMFDDGGVNDIVGSFNFGNPSFSISSGNSDANGYGNFEYAVPSGYYALCTKNLAEYG